MKRENVTIVEQIAALKSETITLPADIMIAVTTRRPEFLKGVNREMKPDEVVMVMDVLAGQMRHVLLLEARELELLEEIKIKRDLVTSIKNLLQCQ